MIRSFAAFAAMVLVLVCGSVFAFADEQKPFVDANEIFVAEADSVPKLIKNGSDSIKLSMQPLSTLYISVEGAEYAESFKDLRVVAAWNKGEEYATAPKIEYRMVYDESGTVELGYRYLVAMQMLDIADMQQRTLSGEFKLAKRKNERAPKVSFTILVQRLQIPDYEKTVFCNSKSRRLISDNMRGTVRIEFYETAYFDVDITTQGVIDIGCSVTLFTDIAERFRGAELRTIIWGKKPIFDNRGRLVMIGEPNEFFYEIKNGRPEKITGSYSEADGGFVVETRRLEGFIISDRELDLSALPVPEENPPTGFYNN